MSIKFEDLEKMFSKFDNENHLEIGDIVSLKSENFTMTVLEIKENNQVYTAWATDDCVVFYGTFPTKALEKKK